MTPEQKSRIEIDKKLIASGWLLQDKKEFNPAAAPGVAQKIIVSASPSSNGFCQDLSYSFFSPSIF